jgi:hypothetical protein
MTGKVGSFAKERRKEPLNIVQASHEQSRPANSLERSIYLISAGLA